MADKKVERSGRERTITPTQKMKASLSDPGTVDMSATTHDKGKSALVDKFKEREERWRREQSLHAQEEKRTQEGAEHGADAEAPEDILEAAERAQGASGSKPAGKGGRPKGGAL